MSAHLRYRLPDEPRPSGLAHAAVDPMWPLLTLMLAGNGLGLLWFAINARALGSPTAIKEWMLVVVSLVGSAALSLGLIWGEQQALLTPDAMPYARLSIELLQLGIGYALFLSQSRCAELVQHYGGVLRNGLPAFLIVAIVARRALDELKLSEVLQAVLV
ncbi:MAG: hypothetical protein KA144_13085 [Xanthomonadaceae bacterium]|nr:hypothetical protein [Xanthomonadaceae bacterium]